MSLIGIQAASAVPNYPEQDGQSGVDHCDNHVSGASRSGGRFVADAYGGAACGSSYVELIYRDTRGVEQTARKQAARGPQGPVAQIILLPSQYSSIIEVIGSSVSLQSGNPTPGVYLYF